MKKYTVLLLLTAVILSAQQNGARYLIITHDNFYNIVKPLAEWKNRTGMKCRIARLSEIGSSADAIRNYVLNAYNNWPLRRIIIAGRCAKLSAFAPSQRDLFG